MPGPVGVGAEPVEGEATEEKNAEAEPAGGESTVAGLVSRIAQISSRRSPLPSTGAKKTAPQRLP